jgi:hypothetical protein
LHRRRLSAQSDGWSRRLQAEVDPDRLSFTRSLRVVRRQTASGRAALPPEYLVSAVAEIGERLLPRRRLRAFARVVKRKMSNFGVKRARHRTWPQPCIPAAEAVVIVEASRPAPTKRRPRATPTTSPSPAHNP